MADIVINDELYTRGSLSIARQANPKDPSKIITTGFLSSIRYFEEITEIETRRFHLTGVKVIEESFGSDDHKILYTFVADGLEIKGIDKDNMSLYTNEELETIEQEVYPGEDIDKVIIDKRPKDDGGEENGGSEGTN